MKIGTITLPHGLFLAPMAGFSDFGMRSVCREMGAEYLTGEMVSANAVLYSREKSVALARVREEELPCAVQIFGHDPAIMANAAAWAAAGVGGGVPPTAIDINMGCPVHKIVAAGDGSALMRDPHLAAQIVAAVKAAVSLPVTVKIRAGWDASSINAPEVARALEAAGADVLCVHGRTRSQGYSGGADWSVIRAVKRAVSIPVVGNGDVTDAASALRMKEQTGCDGVMIGRGAVGNPFVFREVVAALEGRECPPPTPEEKYDLAVRQLWLSVEDKGEVTGILESRKHLCGYLSGVRGGSAARVAVNHATTVQEIKEILAAALLKA